VTHLCFWTVLHSFRDICYLAFITNLLFTDYYFFPMLFGCFTYNINFFWNFGVVIIKKLVRIKLITSALSKIITHGKQCLYCVNCTKFGQLIFMKIIKIVAIRCQILRPKCIKFALPQTHWGSLQRSPDPLAGGEGACCPSPRTLLPALDPTNPDLTGCLPDRSQNLVASFPCQHQSFCPVLHSIKWSPLPTSLLQVARMFHSVS